MADQHGEAGRYWTGWYICPCYPGDKPGDPSGWFSGGIKGGSEARRACLSARKLGTPEVEMRGRETSKAARNLVKEMRRLNRIQEKTFP